ncbi:MAG: hypothetical protein MUP02_08710 [Actinobacteria bacterium]|nr:hypothetical protein [Actinomycetota bacterium]
MKKIISLKTIAGSIIITIAILMLIIITPGCKQPPATPTDTSQTVQETQTQTETKVQTPVTETVTETAPIETQDQQTPDLSKEVETKFGKLEKTVANIGEIFSFIDQNIKDASPELTSEMVYAVLKLCEEYKFDFTDKFNNPEVQSTINSLLTSFENIDLNALLDTDNQKVRGLIQETIDKKYKLMSVEGFIMPLVDYKAYDIYKLNLTKEMIDYMDIKLDESEHPSVLDAGIVIPIDDFVQRIIKSMDYVSNYPDSPRAAEVEQFNKGRIFMYFSGIDNNMVFDSSGKILPDRLTEYQNIYSKYGDTEFGKILRSYLNILEQEGYMRTQKVDDFLSNI